MPKKMYSLIGSGVYMKNLPEGHTMSMGYLSESIYTESEILAVLMEHSLSAKSKETQDVIDSIGAKLGIM